jgi:tetratricopeptide (TPR) repeat protein
MSTGKYSGPYIGVTELFNDLTEEGRETASAYMLARALNIRRVIAFVGSGVSRAYGYLSWKSLANTLLSKYKRDASKERNSPASNAVHRLQPADSDAKALALLEGLVQIFPDRLRNDASKLFAKRTRHPSPDPLRILMQELGIRRFLTTNYDQEIERAFVNFLRCSAEPLGITPPLGESTHFSSAACSLLFSRDSEHMHPERLLQLALGAPGYEQGVFHLHGIHRDPHSMVLTEADYRRLYVEDDQLTRAYREALSLAFSANPILFVGVSLSEPDLMRPLRELLAESTRRQTPERPFFALLHFTKKKDDRQEKSLVYARYGVKPIFYPVDDVDNVDEHTSAICEKLLDLARRWESWWMGWQDKPSLRKPCFFVDKGKSSGSLMVHHLECNDDRVDGTAGPDNLALAPEVKAVNDTLDEKTDHYTKASALIVLGRAGTGKGQLGLRLAQELESRYEKSFFGTMHFVNELHSSIQAAADHFEKEPDKEQSPTTQSDDGRVDSSPFARLEDRLTRGKYLLVLGGIERLLIAPPSSDLQGAPAPKREARILEIGVPANREVERLLEMAKQLVEIGEAGGHLVQETSATSFKSQSNHRSQSLIVFTTSIEPVFPGVESIPTKHLHGMTIETLRCKWTASGTSKALDERWIARLRQTLRGHNYALALVEAALREVAEEKREAWISRLVHRLTAVDISRRPSIVIEIAVSNLLSSLCPPKDHWTVGILQRLSLFPTPVGVAELSATWPRSEACTKTQLEELLTQLLARKLVLCFRGRLGLRYTAHTTVRRYYLHMLGRPIGDIPGELSRLSIAGYSAESTPTAIPPPRTKGGYTFVTQVADDLLDRLDSELRDSPDRQTPTSELLRPYVRAAFGVISSRWSTNTIPQQVNLIEAARAGPSYPHYDAYNKRLIRLANAIRSAQAQLIWFDHGSKDIFHLNATLYADELGWLYHELGAVAYARGQINNAYGLFRISQDVGVAAESGTRGPRWCHSHLSLAAVQIDAANLPVARFHLEKALRGSKELRDRQLEARVLGYLGLLHHLSGSYEDAQTFYKEAVEQLQRQNNRRGLSIFLRHQGDLLRLRERLGDAKQSLADSIAAAESGGHLDLVQYARIAEANFSVGSSDPKASDPRRAFETLSSAIDFAQTMGIPKLEADALRVQSLIAAQQGDVWGASRLAVRCLSIAVALGMRLRVTASLVLLGRINRIRGDVDAARSLLHSAVALGHEQGYQLQVEAAERELMLIGTPLA